MATQAVRPEDVEQLRRRFAEHRQNHAVRSRLPEELWAAAAKLARRDGITATARVLGVDRPSLQKWTDRLEPRASGKAHRSGRRRERGTDAAAFVELLAAGTESSSRCLVEVRIEAGRQTAAGVGGHRHQPTSGTDSHVRSVVACFRSRRRCGF